MARCWTGRFNMWFANWPGYSCASRTRYSVTRVGPDNAMSVPRQYSRISLTVVTEVSPAICYRLAAPLRLALLPSAAKYSAKRQGVRLLSMYSTGVRVGKRHLPDKCQAFQVTSASALGRVSKGPMIGQS